MFHCFLSTIHFPIGALEYALKAIVNVRDVLRHAHGDDHMRPVLLFFSFFRSKDISRSTLSS